MLSGYPSLSVPSLRCHLFSRGRVVATGSLPLRVPRRPGLTAASFSSNARVAAGIAGFGDCANDDHAGGTGGERVVEAAEGNAADGEPRARRSLVRDVFHLTPPVRFLADLVREIEPPGRPAPATLNGSWKLSK